MGREYNLELKELSSTYNWSLAQDIELLKQVIRKTVSFPGLVIGSGGSFTIAVLCAYLSQHLAGALSIACTPLEATSLATRMGKFSAFLISASGHNIDIRRSAEAVIAREPQILSLLTMKRNSLVGEMVESYYEGYNLWYEPPVSKDGYLATNSLMASSVLLARAFISISGMQIKLPGTLNELLGIAKGEYSCIEDFLNSFKTFFSKDHIIILHDPANKAAAIDIESKFTEAALKSVNQCDFRAFAHGRHNWLNRFSKTTSVIGLCSASNEQLASNTLGLIPDDIPVRLINTGRNPIESALVGVAFAIFITGVAADTKKIDPGRPFIPDFGRQLYKLDYSPDLSRPIPEASPRAIVSIERKSKRSIREIVNNGIYALYQESYDSYTRKLSQTDLSAIVLDYDGTIVSLKNRFKEPEKDLVERLVRLLDNGMYLGVATGRGKSVVDDLKAALPHKVHEKVVVGMHNGAIIQKLSGGTISAYKTAGSSFIKEVEAPFKKLNLIYPDLRLSRSDDHVSIRNIELRAKEEIFSYLSAWAKKNNIENIKIMSSGHSVDVFEAGVTKLRVVNALEKLYGISQNAVLTLGDSGNCGGNDFELLNRFPSLSVSETSLDLEFCWNISKRGNIGIAATKEYLDAITKKESKKSFSLSMDF